MQDRVILLAFLLIASSSVRLFLIGGNTDQKSPLVFQQLAKTVPSRSPQPNQCDLYWCTTNCPRIAVVTSALPSQQKGNQAFSDDSQKMSFFTMFRLFGMSPRHISIHRDNYKVHGDIKTPEGQQNLKIILQADIIFFNGGDPSMHIRSWLKDNGQQTALLAIIKERVFNHELVLAGTSAGAMIWGSVVVSGGDSFGILYFRNLVGLAPKRIQDGQKQGSGFLDTRNGNDSLQYRHNGGKIKAVGWLDWHVDPHFNALGRLGKLIPVLYQTGQSLGVGIDEQTALYYKDGVGTVYGYKGATICDMSETTIKPQSFFTANNIRAHYLTFNDQYSFHTKTVISNKLKIIEPKYSGYTDSDDILAPYQVTQLITKVVDQKALYNLGRTKPPLDFDVSTTPKFEIKFSRSDISQGYYADQMYTASNIVLDFAFGSAREQLSKRD